jgi:hypothetical protein
MENLIFVGPPISGVICGIQKVWEGYIPFWPDCAKHNFCIFGKVVLILDFMGHKIVSWPFDEGSIL